MKHRITLTDKEITILAHLTRHFMDYTLGDDRPDHGMGILKTYRELNRDDELIQAFVSAMGKLNRMERKIYRKS